MQALPVKFDNINLDALRKKSKDVFSVLDVSETTRKDYSARIEKFYDFLLEFGFNRHSFLLYKRHLESRNDYAVSSKNKMLISAKIFLKELARSGVIPDITGNIRIFRISKDHKREPITHEEMLLIASHYNSIELTPDEARTKAIVAMMAYQGLREVELVRLDAKNVNLKKKIAYIQGKGHDDVEKVHLHPTTAKCLREYMSMNWIKDSGPFFIASSHNNRYGRVTTRTIRRWITSFLNSIGIFKPPHSFRHFFTTQLCKTFPNEIFTVAGFTRHKSIETVQNYNHASEFEKNLPKYYSTFSVEL